MLAQENGKANQGHNGEKLALPVLKRLKPEPRSTHIFHGGYGRLALVLLLNAVYFGPSLRV
ncbi:hypothetical protein SAMN06269173_106235 [Hymenobacter mucosus]|uniref:Uncharacterized protein n=1 Tax=Hymenobacter mucosus TaxID=1411120 RepID=A0A238Z1P6_9BACT|nr:hypothetical protein SAMN06269173_106235 [Hymenobacter mucosus]